MCGWFGVVWVCFAVDISVVSSLSVQLIDVPLYLKSTVIGLETQELKVHLVSPTEPPVKIQMGVESWKLATDELGCRPGLTTIRSLLLARLTAAL